MLATIAGIAGFLLVYVPLMTLKGIATLILAIMEKDAELAMETTEPIKHEPFEVVSGGLK